MMSQGIFPCGREVRCGAKGDFENMDKGRFALPPPQCSLSTFSISPDFRIFPDFLSETARKGEKSATLCLIDEGK